MSEAQKTVGLAGDNVSELPSRSRVSYAAGRGNQDQTDQAYGAVHARRLLTEKGGIGLCAFHLARLGYEFEQTTGASPRGDLWVQLPDRKVGIEVKTNRIGNAWHIPLRQIGMTEFYCLVILNTAKAYVLTTQQLREAIEGQPKMYPGVAKLAIARLPVGCSGAWHILEGLTEPASMAPRAEKILRPNVVKRRRSDGTIVVYTYPRFRVERPRMVLAG